jgi:ribosomal protein S18 acetylase RimI-like enzyme
MIIAKKINGETAAELTLTKLVGNEWEIQFLKVEPAHRGKGIATELLEKAKAHAVKKQLILIAFVDPSRDGGLTHEQIKSWLVKHGFKHSWYNFNEAKNRCFFKGGSKRVLIFNE